VNGYTKLFGSILDSTVWELPHPTVRVWVTLLAMADRHGEIQASVPGLAHRARVTLEETKTALAAFLGPDEYSRTPTQEGRRVEPIDGGWRLVNHEKYRRLMAEEDRKAKAAERQRRYVSNRQQASAPVSECHKRQNDAIPDTEAKADAEAIDPEIVTSPSARDGAGVYSAHFLTFWMSYPRKVGKGDAWKAWKRLKPELPPVLRAIANQRVTPDWRKDNGAFIPHPATWLNGRRWEDEPNARMAPARVTGPPVAIAEAMGQRAAKDAAERERERLAQGEKFRQERERDAGVVG
jgi:hypothetical protein